MAGILNPYYYYDDSNLVIEHAHHEVGHALRGHSLGVKVAGVYLSYHPFGKTQASFAGDLSRHPAETHIQIGIAGPVTTMRFLRGRADDIFFCDRSKVLGEVEDDADLTKKIRKLEYQNAGHLVKFSDLTADFLVDAELVWSDDFSSVFDIIISEHYNRYYRIPRIKTILNTYRYHESICREWVDQNWPAITKLAEHLLQTERPTTTYTCSLRGPEFRRYVKAHAQANASASA